MTQQKQILDHLMNKGSITSMEAFMLYGATRLSGQIFELRRKGFDIQSVWMDSTNRFGEPVRFVKYTIGGRNEDQSKCS